MPHECDPARSDNGVEPHQPRDQRLATGAKLGSVPHGDWTPYSTFAEDYASDQFSESFRLPSQFKFCLTRVQHTGATSSSARLSS
eukprot:5670884-Amphidinium_carterae.4